MVRAAAAEVLVPVTVIVGSEQVLADRAVAEVSRAVRAADPQVQKHLIDAGDDQAVSRLREAAAPSLFGDGALVQVTGLDQADDALAGELKALAADPSGGVYLVLVHPGGVKGKGLLDALAKAGARRVDCPQVKKGKATTEFLAKEMARHRRKATTDALETLYEAIGHDLGLLCAAISQLCADVETDPITAEDVSHYFAGVAEASGYAMADAVWERRYADALRTLRQAMIAEDASRVGPMSVSALAAGLRSLVRVGGMPPGASEADIAREAGVPPWKVGSLRRQWTRWSGDQRRLAAAVVALADADGAVKGGVGAGTSLDPEQKLLYLESLVARTAASRTS